jgi:hypothetical protein
MGASSTVQDGKYTIKRHQKLSPPESQKSDAEKAPQNEKRK